MQAFLKHIIIVTIMLPSIIPHRIGLVRYGECNGNILVLGPIWKALLRSHIFILIIYTRLWIFYLLKIYVPSVAFKWRQYENRKYISNSKLRMLYDVKCRDEIAHVQLSKDNECNQQHVLCWATSQNKLEAFFPCVITADN